MIYEMNKQFIKNILQKLGVNEAVFYFLAGKGFSVIAAPLTLYLIVSYFSPFEQGYYYTFSSLLALSIFFELGLGVVVTHFASHEYANLSWTETGNLAGDSKALSRLISLLRKSLIWYAIISGLFIAFILPGGLLFFSSNPESVNIGYILPWILLVVFFGLNTCFIPLTSALEGCGRISQVQRLRVIQSVAGIICGWVIIVMGGKLLAVSASFIAFFCVNVTWFIYNYKSLLLQVVNHKSEFDVQVLWLREIFPIQWRIAVSWLSIYFSTYLFIPILFAYRGPIEAGKMGMSLKISDLVFLLSMAWINTRVPQYGALIQKKKYEELDNLAYKTTMQAIFAGIIFTITVIVAIVLISKYTSKNYLERILPLSIVVVLCVASIAVMITSSIGGYLRAHKQEPLMPVLVIMALITAILSYLSARFYDANIMSLFYAGIQTLVGIPLFYYVLLRKKKEWHGI